MAALEGPQPRRVFVGVVARLVGRHRIVVRSVEIGERPLEFGRRDHAVDFARRRVVAVTRVVVIVCRELWPRSFKLFVVTRHERHVQNVRGAPTIAERAPSPFAQVAFDERAGHRLRRAYSRHRVQYLVSPLLNITNEARTRACENRRRRGVDIEIATAKLVGKRFERE